MNSNISKMNNDFTTNLKEIVTKRWNKEKKKAAIPYEEVYKQMVKEAVLVIKDDLERDAKYSKKTNQEAESIKLESINAFLVTKKDLKLYSSKGYRTQNPQTGACCFFTVFQFNSYEEIKKYVEDVMALLPEGMTYEETEVNEVVLGKSIGYSFYLNLDIQ